MKIRNGETKNSADHILPIHIFRRKKYCLNVIKIFMCVNIRKKIKSGSLNNSKIKNKNFKF